MTAVAVRRSVDRICARPLVAAVLVALPSALLSAWNIWHQRLVGSYDPDEAGYLALALRLQRSIDPAHPGAVLHELSRASTGPLVPALSVATLLIGPRDPRSAMLIQPVLLILLAVACAGIVRRISTDGRAVTAAAFIVALPNIVWSTESYWLGLGAATAMALALWALLASDRLADRWRAAGFGLAVAAMLLARTMTVAFIPGLAGAVLLLVWGDRRRTANAVGAGMLALLVAGPWYVARRHEVFGYLLSYGYSGKAARFGTGNVVQRVLLRAFFLGYHAWFVIAPLAVLGLVVAVARRPSGPFASWTQRRRGVLALAVVAGAGVIALSSSSNRGIWFDLPLVAPALAVGMVAIDRWGVRPSRLLGIGLVAFALFGPMAVRMGHLDRVEFGASQYDARFAEPRSARARAAAGDWATFNDRIARRLRLLTRHGLDGEVVMSGSTFPVNANSVQLAAELDRWRLVPLVPDTSNGPAAWQDDLRPTSRITRYGRPLERIIVVLHHDYLPFPVDDHWRDFEQAARASGWRTVDTIEMPGDRGRAEILRHQVP